MTKDTQLLWVRAGVQTRAPGFTFQAAPTNSPTPTPKSIVGLGRITITQSVVILRWPPGFSLCACIFSGERETWSPPGRRHWLVEETDMTQTPPENEMVSRVLSTARKHRGLQGVTTGTKPGLTLTTVTTNPTFQWLHSPSVGIRSDPREKSGDPGGQRLYSGWGHPGSICGKGGRDDTGEGFRPRPASGPRSIGQCQPRGPAYLQGRLEWQSSWCPAERA